MGSAAPGTAGSRRPTDVLPQGLPQHLLALFSSGLALLSGRFSLGMGKGGHLSAATSPRLPPRSAPAVRAPDRRPVSIVTTQGLCVPLGAGA